MKNFKYKKNKEQPIYKKPIQLRDIVRSSIIENSYPNRRKNKKTIK